MEIFSKIDKKVLIILAITLIVILLIGFAVYEYLTRTSVKVDNSLGGAQIEKSLENNSGNQNNDQQVQIQAGGVRAQAENGGGSFTVCVDKCGDNVCQKTDSNCTGGDNLNCVCPETPQECPQDCK